MKAWQVMCVAAAHVAACSLPVLAPNPVGAEVVRNGQFSEVSLVWDPFIGPDVLDHQKSSDEKAAWLRAPGNCGPFGCMSSVEFDVEYYDPLEALALLGDKHGLVAKIYDGDIFLAAHVADLEDMGREKAEFTTWMEFTVRDEDAPYLMRGPNQTVYNGDRPIWNVELYDVDTNTHFPPTEGTLPEGTYRWSVSCYVANPESVVPGWSLKEFVRDMWVRFDVGWLQQYTFGDWASGQGYVPGAVMPSTVNALSSIPPTVPKIDQLEGIGAFDWTTTTALYLTRNQISSIEAGDFHGLENLETLDLYENKIWSIAAGAFDGLENLETLDLGANQIWSIAAGAFDGLENLATLNLGHNQISSIEAGDFHGLTNLATLNLNHNRVSSIQSVDVEGLTNLSSLSLGNQISSIEAGDFDGLENLETLDLSGNQISSIEAGDFDGLENLETLYLSGNQISSIEAGLFSELTNLQVLYLRWNPISSIAPGAFSGLHLTQLNLRGIEPLTELNLTDTDFSGLREFDAWDNEDITSISLKNTFLNQTSLGVLINGGDSSWGMYNLDGITKLDLSGVDFANITNLRPLYVIDDLTDLWLVNTANLDANALDLLLDNLETIEGTDVEGILYMTQADFDAFNAAGGGLLADWHAELGHHVEFLSPGDINHDTEVNDLDVNEFTHVLLASRFDVAADMNGDGAVNGLDVEPFVAAVGGGAQQIPEPSTLLLALVALVVVGGWRKWKRAA